MSASEGEWIPGKLPSKRSHIGDGRLLTSTRITTERRVQNGAYSQHSAIIMFSLVSSKYANLKVHCITAGAEFLD